MREYKDFVGTESTKIYRKVFPVSIVANEYTYMYMYMHVLLHRA